MLHQLDNKQNIEKDEPTSPSSTSEIAKLRTEPCKKVKVKLNIFRNNRYYLRKCKKLDYADKSQLDDYEEELKEYVCGPLKDNYKESVEQRIAQVVPSSSIDATTQTEKKKDKFSEKPSKMDKDLKQETAEDIVDRVFNRPCSVLMGYRIPKKTKPDNNNVTYNEFQNNNIKTSSESADDSTQVDTSEKEIKITSINDETSDTMEKLKKKIRLVERQGVLYMVTGENPLLITRVTDQRVDTGENKSQLVSEKPLKDSKSSRWDQQYCEPKSQELRRKISTRSHNRHKINKEIKKRERKFPSKLNPYLTDVPIKITPKLKPPRHPPDKSSSQNADVMEHFKKRLIHQLENSPRNRLVEQPFESAETTNNDENSKSTDESNVAQNDRFENNSAVGLQGNKSNNGILATSTESRFLNSLSGPGPLDTTSENRPFCTKSESEYLVTKQNAGMAGTKSKNSSSEMAVKKKEEAETCSLSGSSSATNVEKKKEVIQKIARKKAVSRSQFRHDDIPMFKLGRSIHNQKKNFLLNLPTEKKLDITDKNVPKELLTADIISAMDGNKSPLGRHNLPKILYSEDLRKHTEDSEKRQSSHGEGSSDISESKHKKKKREHVIGNKHIKKHHSKRDSIKNESRTFKPLNIRLEDIKNEDISGKKLVMHKSKKRTKNGKNTEKENTKITKVETKTSSETDNTLVQATEESQHLTNSVANEEEQTSQKNHKKYFASQNSNNLSDTNTYRTNSETNKLKNTEGGVQMNDSEIRNITSSKNTSSPNTLVSEQAESSKPVDMSQSLKHSSSPGKQNDSRVSEAPIINIQSLTEDAGTNETNGIQIRITSINPLDNIEKSKPAMDDAYIESLLALVKSTMHPTKLCIEVLGILNFYYKNLSKRLETELPIGYKEKIKQTLDEILLYMEKQLFDNSGIPELKDYTKQIMESDLIKHKEFVEVHLHVLNKKCDDDLWMKTFIQTLTQSKQYAMIPKNTNWVTSSYKQNEPNKTDVNMESTLIQNHTIVNDYLNVNASAKALDNLQKFQSAAMNSDTSNSNVGISRSPHNHDNHPFTVPSSLIHETETTQAVSFVKEKRKYTKKRNECVQQETTGFSNMFPSNLSSYPRINRALPEAGQIYIPAHRTKLPPPYSSYTQNVRDKLHRAKNGNSSSNTIMHPQYGVSTNPPSDSGVLNLYTGVPVKHQQGTAPNSVPRQYDNNFSAMPNRLEMLPNKQTPTSPFAPTNKERANRNNLAPFNPWHGWMQIGAINQRSYRYDSRIPGLNITSHENNTLSNQMRMVTNANTNQIDPRSANFGFQNFAPQNNPQKGTTSRSIENPSPSRNYAQNLYSVGHNLIPNHLNVPMPNRTQWHSSQPITLNHHISNNQSNGSDSSLSGNHLAHINFNHSYQPVRGQNPAPIAHPKTMTRNNKTKQINEIRTNTSSTSDSVMNMAVQGIPYPELMERNIDKRRATQYQGNAVSIPSNNSINDNSNNPQNMTIQGIPHSELMESNIDKRRATQYQGNAASIPSNNSINHNPKNPQNGGEMVASGYLAPQNFSIARNPQLRSPHDNIPQQNTPEKSDNKGTWNESISPVKKCSNSSSFRVENLVSPHTNKENSQHRELDKGIARISSTSPHDNTKPAVVSSFSFLQEICSPPPTPAEIHSNEVLVGSHSNKIISEIEMSSSFRKENEVTPCNQTISAPVSKVNKDIELNSIIPTNDKNDCSGQKDVIIDKEIIFQDNTLQITKGPLKQSFKREEIETDVAIIKKIKTDSYEVKDDKNILSHMHTSYVEFDRNRTMVDLLKSIRPDVYREVRRKTDMKAFSEGVMEVTAVITIDDDEDTAITSPGSVTLEKVTEDVPARRLRPNEETSSDSVIITSEKTTDLANSVNSNTQPMKIYKENASSEYFSSVHHCEKSSPIEHMNSESCTGFNSKTKQMELRQFDEMSHTLVSTTPEGSETANCVPTDLSKNISTSKLSSKNVNRVEIYYTAPGRIISPIIERVYEHSKSSVSTVSSSGFQLPSSYSELTPPPSATLPAIEDISCEATQEAHENSDEVQTNRPSIKELERTISSGAIFNKRRTSGPLDLSIEDDQNSAITYSSSNPAFRNTFAQDAANKRQELVTSPIRCDITSVTSPTKYISTKDWKSSFTQDPKTNFREFFKIRRHSVESRSSFSDTSSPIPADDMTTVTMGNSNFLIRKMFVDYIPKGKLYYKKETNTFVQCYVNGETRKPQIVSEPQLPQQWIFSSEADFEDAALFSKEFEKVQKFVPKDFAQYYRFVTGYQIFRHMRPISFHTFLEMHNGDRMDTFFFKYLGHLQKFSLTGLSNPEDWNVT